jgi:hypothetical protein
VTPATSQRTRDDHVPSVPLHRITTFKHSVVGDGGSANGSSFLGGFSLRKKQGSDNGSDTRDVEDAGDGGVVGYNLDDIVTTTNNTDEDAGSNRRSPSSTRNARGFEGINVQVEVCPVPFSITSSLVICFRLTQSRFFNEYRSRKPMTTKRLKIHKTDHRDKKRNFEPP